MKEKILCIIPARSGSKGLPDKNVKLLREKPLLAYTVEAAKKSNIFAEVMVSTDSRRYADIAEGYGASVPFLRSAETASDKATTREAVLEVVQKYGEMGKKFDALCILQPTSPLRTVEDIIRAKKIFDEKNAKAVISVCEAEHSPLWENTLPKDNSMANFIHHDIAEKPRQMLEKYYRINGAVYLYDMDFYMGNENPYVEGCYAYIMDRKASIDIDEQTDFDLTELLLK